MTSVILNVVKPPRQVAPSSSRYARHLSRFNGRAYSRKGDLPRRKYHRNIKSDGFAFPGDFSLTLNMTSVILNVVKNLPEGWFTAECILR